MLTAQNDTQSTDQVVATPVGSAPSAQFIPTNSFLDVLFEKKQLTLEQIEELRKDGLSSGKSYEVLIGEKKTVSEAVINEAKAVFNHLGYIDLGTVGIDPEALGLLDESIAKRYKVLPFALDKEKNSIKIAMLDPLDLPTIEFLRQKTNRDVEAYYADTEVLQRLIVERYSQNLSTEVDEALRTTNQYQQRAAGGVVVNNSGQILRDAPINRIVENILDFAISSRASDVHIEPQGSNIRVRYRIDGILVEKLILPKNVHEAVISRIKIMSNLKIDEKRLPQDGRFNYVSSGKEVDLRISTLPTVNGEKVVMRLLEKNATVPSLQDLGLSGLALRRLMSFITRFRFAWFSTATSDGQYQNSSRHHSNHWSNWLW